MLLLVTEKLERLKNKEVYNYICYRISYGKRTLKKLGFTYPQYLLPLSQISKTRSDDRVAPQIHTHNNFFYRGLLNNLSRIAVFSKCENKQTK